MMQCVQHGHVIVALANLKPRDGGRDNYFHQYDMAVPLHFLKNG